MKMKVTENIILYSDFSNEYIDDIIDIGVKNFGENYITREEILKYVNKDNEMCTLAIDADTNKLMGYCLFFAQSVKEAQKDFNISNEELNLFKGLNLNKEICHAKSISISSECKGRGIGYELFKKTLDKAKKLGYKLVLCPAWKRGDFIPVEKILLKTGFTYLKTVSNMWEDNKDYKCVDCNGPCKCDAAIYYKIY